MRPAHVRERPMGMRYYASTSPGIGGRLKTHPTDFRVIEVPGLEVEPLDANTGDYGYLIVEATTTGRDTHDMIDTLAGALGIHPGAVAVSGTKDANAVTTQWVSIRHGSADELPAIEDVDLEPVGRLGRQLEFGDHAANRFEVTVHAPTHPEWRDAISIELTTEDGSIVVPNFFGHQRFGARRSITHVVGQQLVRGDIEGAIRTYLTASSPHEPARTRLARTEIEGALDVGDLEQAIAVTPGYLTYERRLLGAMRKGATVEDVLDALPWSLVRLFVHAVQSHAFNELVSERMRRGISLTEPQVGDTICFVDGEGQLDTERAQGVTESRLQTARRHVARGRAVVVAPLLGPETPPFEGPIGAMYDAVIAGLDLSRDGLDAVSVTDVSALWRPIALTTELEIDESGPTFSFELPPGSYATVIMREFCKVDPVAMA